MAYRLLRCRVAAMAWLDGLEAHGLMEDNMSEFIRHLRRQLGMTQEEFAHRLGINHVGPTAAQAS